MRRTGYAVGGSVGNAPLDSYGSWSSPSAGGGATNAGAMPEIPGAGAAGGVPAGGDFSGGGEGGDGGGGEAAYQHGGPVRRRRRRRRRLLRRRPRPLLNGRHPPRLRRPLRRRRRLRTGYAGGGSISPTLMSVSLDTRSKNPQHYAEDREALATRPSGAPGAPDAFGYAQGGEVYTPTADFSPQANFTPTIGAAIDNRLSMMGGEEAEPEGEPSEPGSEDEEMARGGPVRRRKRGRRPIGRTGYQEGGEVDDEEEDDIEPGGYMEPDAELAQPDEEDFQPDEEEGLPPDEMEPPPEEDEGEGGEQAPGEAPPGEEPPPEEGGGGGGSGGGGAGEKPPTGFKPQDQQDEEDIPAGAQPTGYSPDAAPAQSPLKEVLDYTRKQFGVGQEKPAAAAEPPPSDREAAANEVASRIPVPTGAPSGRTGIGAPEDTSTELQPSPQQPETAAPAVPGQTGMPAPPPAAPPPQQSIVTGPSQAPRGEQGVAAYASGAGALSPDQMTQLLDRTNQTNPNLDQNGSIHKAFNDLVSKGDIDTASKFVQALRPSYDNMRALMIAAVAKGDFASAMQVAEKMNNLVPNGQQIQFAQGNGGIISAIIKPEGGGQPQALQMTPEQFGRYANSPLSLFDHVSEQGLAKNLSMVGAQPRPEYNAQGDVPRGAPPGSRNVQIPDGRTLTIAPDPGSMERGQPTYTRGLVVSETPTGQRPYDITSPANARVSQGQPAAPYGTAAERANPRIGYSGTASDRFYAPYGQLGGGPAPPMPDGSPGGPIPAYPPPPRSGLAGTQYAENRIGATMSDAAPIGAAPGTQTAQAKPPPAGGGFVETSPGTWVKPGATAPERPANLPPVGAAATANRPPPGKEGMVPVTINGETRWFPKGNQAPNQAAPSQAAPGQGQRAPGQESEAMRSYRLDKKAYDAFPYDNQDTRRGEYRRALEIQDQKQRAAREQNQFKDTPADKMTREQYKQGEQNARAKTASEDRRFQAQVSKDNAFMNAMQRHMTASQNNGIKAMIAERKAYESSPNYSSDKPWIPSEDQKALMAEVYKAAKNNGMFDQGPTPPLGGYQPPAQQQQQAQPDRYEKTYPSNKDRPEEPPQIRLEPGERWLKGNKGNWRLEKIPQ